MLEEALLLLEFFYLPALGIGMNLGNLCSFSNYLLSLSYLVRPTRITSRNVAEQWHQKPVFPEKHEILIYTYISNPWGLSLLLSG